MARLAPGGRLKRTSSGTPGRRRRNPAVRAARGLIPAAAAVRRAALETIQGAQGSEPNNASRQASAACAIARGGGGRPGGALRGEAMQKTWPRLSAKWRRHCRDRRRQQSANRVPARPVRDGFPTTRRDPPADRQRVSHRLAQTAARP